MQEGLANKFHIYFFTPFLSVNLGLSYITADAFMIREKLRISFARLIPEVSAGEREMERIKRVQGQKKGGKENEGGEKKAITGLASVGLCPGSNCDSFSRASASLSGEAERPAEGRDGRMSNISHGKQTVTYTNGH